MISVLNFKSYDKGAIRGFFDLRYHGLTIKGCRLMNTNGGLWIAFPQRLGEKDGETKWFDQMYLTAPEMDHVRKMVIADLRSLGIIEKSPRRQHQSNDRGNKAPGTYRTSEGGDLSQPYSGGSNDDIPF